MKRSSAARSLLRLFFIIATVVLVGVFLIVGFWRPGLFRGQFNAGHQLGGDIQAGCCGNTVDVFQRSLAQCEERDDLLYWECDLRETKDQEIERLQEQFYEAKRQMEIHRTQFDNLKVESEREVGDWRDKYRQLEQEYTLEI